MQTIKPVCESMREYRCLLENLQLSKNTIKQYINAVCHYLENRCQMPPTSHADTSDLSEHDAHEFIQGTTDASRPVYNSAIGMFFAHILSRPLPVAQIENERPKILGNLPNPIARPIIKKILSHSRHGFEIVFMLVYGEGLSINEAVELRIQDIANNYRSISIRNVFGNVLRTVNLIPEEAERLKKYVENIKQQALIGSSDGKSTCTYVEHPSKKNTYVNDLQSQYLFASQRRHVDKKNGIIYCKPVNRTTLHRELNRIVGDLQATKDEISFMMVKDSHGVHCLEAGEKIESVRNRLGHIDARTTLRLQAVVDGYDKPSPRDLIVEHYNAS